jgi:hypothetical protein
MAVPVMIGVLVGLVVGGAAMALWAAGRIGEEAARQFDRGFERGRWLADLSVTRALEPPQRTPPRPPPHPQRDPGPARSRSRPPASVRRLRDLPDPRRGNS